MSCHIYVNVYLSIYRIYYRACKNVFWLLLNGRQWRWFVEAQHTIGQIRNNV